MTLRDRRQQEFADVFFKYGMFGTLYLCPRFGKIFTTINILDKMEDDIYILIAYPDVSIKESWKEDFKKRKYNDCNVVYTTHMSLKKHVNTKFDLVILDEIHLLSDNQLQEAQNLLKINNKVLGLTGTLSNDSQKMIYHYLKLTVLAKYNIETAIKEGVITDYEINVHSVPLDNKMRIKFKNKIKTEKQQFSTLSFIINKIDEEGGNSFFMKLARMRLLQNSVAKVEWVRNYLYDNKDKRILVFCGSIEISENLGIPFHHSKSNNKEEFLDFASGEGNQMAVVNIGMTGVTYKPLNEVIILSFDSNAEKLTQKINRCMAMEYNSPDKKSHIIVLCSDKEEEKAWLKKSISFFDKNKINYV